MIRRAISRLHIVRDSKSSLMKKTVATPLTGSAVTIYPPSHCFSTGIGNDMLHSETICSSLERRRDILTPVNDNDFAIDETSTTTLDNESRNSCKHTYGQCMGALGEISNSDCRTLSVHSDTTRYYDTESQIQKGGREDTDLSSSTEAGITAAVAFIRQIADPLPSAGAKYACATETYGCTEVRVGKGDYIPRWRRGAKLTYTINVGSFPTSAEAMQVKAATQEAISMWRGIGVRFIFKDLEVDCYDSATFVVTHQRHGPRNTYASSFFPDDSPADLLVYSLALSNTTHLANILAHEIGHILGLRHEFADKKHPEGRILRCVNFGEKNPQSIMNYYKDPGQLQVSEQDLRELEEFYAYDGERYKGLPIYDYDPTQHRRISREETRCSHIMNKSGRRFSYRTLLVKMDSFISETLHSVK